MRGRTFRTSPGVSFQVVDDAGTVVASGTFDIRAGYVYSNLVVSVAEGYEVRPTPPGPPIRLEAAPGRGWAIDNRPGRAS